MAQNNKEVFHAGDRLANPGYFVNIRANLQRLQGRVNEISVDRRIPWYQTLSHGTVLLSQRYITVAPETANAYAEFTREEQPLAVDELNAVYQTVRDVLPPEIEQKYRFNSPAYASEGKIHLPYFRYDHRLTRDEIVSLYANQYGTKIQPHHLRLSGLIDGREWLYVLVFPSAELAEIDALEPVPVFALGAIEKKLT